MADCYGRFDIKGNLESIPQGRFIVPPVIPALDADCYLDGKRINCKAGETRIEDGGMHKLRVVGSGFDKEYVFEYANMAMPMSLAYGGAILFVAIVLGSVVLVRRRKS